MWYLASGRTLAALALTLGLVVSDAAAQRTFDTNGDGKIELTILDTDGDGYYEWPTGTSKFAGRLVFASTDRIAFRGTTTIQTANGLFADSGSELVTLPDAPLQKLTITGNRGDMLTRGLVDLVVTGDLVVTSYGYVSLFGQTRIHANGTIALQSKTAAVGVSQLTPDDVAPGAFALLAGKQITLTAKGNQAGFLVDAVRIGGRVVSLSAQSSATRAPILVHRGAVLTTNPTLTQLPGAAGNLTIANQRAGIEVRGSTIDAGKDLILKAQYGGGNFELRDQGVVIARGGGALGLIDTRAIAGAPLREPDTTVTGVVRGKPFQIIPPP